MIFENIILNWVLVIVAIVTFNLERSVKKPHGRKLKILYAMDILIFCLACSYMFSLWLYLASKDVSLGVQPLIVLLPLCGLFLLISLIRLAIEDYFEDEIIKIKKWI
ncbi:hypothetical protein HYS03_02320 [Candidatus Woesebacteria bacterium]|nr:hypothetical protein [Candidatus Woesebacteria bacterium]QQG47155.1 MAG: hypothetical protein HY044_03375 [Candidatus Woesebacteria bacterium]